MRADTAPSEQKRLYELDLLRFLSAMFVVSYHYAGVNSGFWTQGARHLFPELAPVARFGHLGVLLFFMISGFVILMSGWGRQIGDFAVSRITRLFPAYWASVALTVVVFYTAGTFFANASGPDSVPRRLLPNLTMLEGGVGADYMEGLYWTLWTELHFYVLIAILIYCGVTYSRSVGFMVTWLLLIILLALPVPFDNLIPALAILFFCLALLEGDGVMAMLGWFFTVVTVIWTIFLLTVGHMVIGQLLKAIF